MQIVTSPRIMQSQSLELKRSGKRIGFVPTMGSLHEGHLSLVRLAQQHADWIVVSIFVNPTQFGPGEDFKRYPRTFESDRRLCERERVDVVFFPSTEDMYGPSHTVFIDESSLSRVLCGTSRPTHFRGVLTVVAKLFNLVLPDVAVFGQKDAQQARLIEKMVEELNFPVRIIRGSIVRESDGLAMSSRNRYLSKEERQEALCLHHALNLAEELFRNGERNADTLIEQMRQLISSMPSASPDYIQIVDAESLVPVSTLSRPALAALAVRFGKTRLIDNRVLQTVP